MTNVGNMLLSNDNDSYLLTVIQNSGLITWWSMMNFLPQQNPPREAMEFSKEAVSISMLSIWHTQHQHSFEHTEQHTVRARVMLSVWVNVIKCVSPSLLMKCAFTCIHYPSLLWTHTPLTQTWTPPIPMSMHYTHRHKCILILHTHHSHTWTPHIHAHTHTLTYIHPPPQPLTYIHTHSHAHTHMYSPTLPPHTPQKVVVF